MLRPSLVGNTTYFFAGSGSTGSGRTTSSEASGPCSSFWAGGSTRVCALACKWCSRGGGTGARDVLALELREGAASPSLTHQDLISRNWTELQALVQGRGKITVRPIEFWSAEGRRD